MSAPLATLALLMLGSCAALERGDPPPADAIEQAVLDATSVGDTAVTTAPDAASQDDTGEPLDVLEEPDLPDDPPVRFGEVHPLLVASCTSGGCHGGGAGGYTISGTEAADYTATLDRVVPGDPESSKLLAKASNTSSHSGGPVLAVGAPDYELLADWIRDGAQP